MARVVALPVNPESLWDAAAAVSMAVTADFLRVAEAETPDDATAAAAVAVVAAAAAAAVARTSAAVAAAVKTSAVAAALVAEVGTS